MSEISNAESPAGVLATSLALFNDNMQRIDQGILLAGTCIVGEFYVTATINSGKANRKDYVMRASYAALKEYAPMVGLTGAEILEWSHYSKGIMGELDIEKVVVGGGTYIKPAGLGEGQYYRTQWCRVIQRPTNCMYVDPRKIWIDINSIVEI